MGIEIVNISKSFNDCKAVDNVSLSIESGKLTALLGPSGSGKTTLLRLIAGLELPDGSVDSYIKISGSDISGKKVRERKVGFVFQHYALFRHMTVFENIAFGLKIKQKKIRPSAGETKNIVNELLKLIQLENMSDRFPSQLSGGQRQRVALARALAIKPAILLLDEPFGALDAKVRAELRKWIRDLHDKLHITSVFVTHDQEEALEVADKIVIMNNGRIEQTGTPEEVFRNPSNEFVLRFLGDVNVFHERTGFLKGFSSLRTTKNVDQQGKIIVRPYEFEVTKIMPDNEEELMTVQTLKIHKAGNFVKIDFKSFDDQIIQVHLSHKEFSEIELNIGDKAYIKPISYSVY